VTSSRAEAPGTGQPGALGSSAPRDTATWAVAAAVGVFPLLLRWTSGGGAAELAVLAPGLAGLVCLSVLLSGIVSRSGAAWASILLLYASSLYGPWTSATEAGPTVGFLLATGVLTVWWGGHAHLSLLRACVLGALIGAAAVAQGLSSLLIALPVVSLSLEPEGRRRSAATRVLVTLACFALVAVPAAMLGAWEPRFRLGGPDLGVALFSSVRGFLFWAPLAWAGLLGCASLWPQDRRASVALLFTLAAMVGVGSWLADPRDGATLLAGPLDAAWPLLGFGLGLGLESLRVVVAKRPGSALATAGAILVIWNFLLMQQYRDWRIPRDGTVSFARIAANSADTLARLVGTPMAWPANWLFAARHGLPVQRFDTVVGARIFEGRRAVIDLGDDRVDPSLLGDGWLRRAPCEGAICREISQRAQILAPLPAAESLALTLRARGSGTLRLAVNGATVGAFPLGAPLQEHRVRVPAHRWRRGVNEIGLSVAVGDRASVDLLTLDRVETRP
jgi:hypothetical protein